MGAMMPGDVVSFGANTLGVYPPTTQVWAVDSAATSREPLPFSLSNAKHPQPC